MPETMLTILDAEQLVALVFAVLAVGLLMFSVRRRLRQHQQQPDRDSPQREPLPTRSTKEHLRRDLETLIGELNDLSRRISAEIDTRFIKLETAMRDADRRIAVLTRLAQQTPDQPGEAPPTAGPPDVRHAVVYELADAGASPVEIARQLGKTPGEVELILKLRGKADDARRADSKAT